VTVRVEMEDKTTAASVTPGRRDQPREPLLKNSRFILPASRRKSSSPPPGERSDETIVNAGTAEALIRRILITVLWLPT